MSNKKWVAGWGASIDVIAMIPADYFKDQTFRYVIFPTMYASAIRLRFSNQYGSESVTIDKVFLAKTAGGEFVDPSTNARVTFGGSNKLIMAPGEDAVSDPVEFPVKAGEEFSVSLYFAGLTRMYTGHTNSGHYIKKYYGRGDWAEAAGVSLEDYGEDCPYVFLHTIDFLASDDCRAIIAFGDSITAQPWPDCLARRMLDLGISNRAIIRKGIGGSYVLLEYTFRIKRHRGEKGINRFERDITQSGADRVFVLHGINDITHPKVNDRYGPMSEFPDATELIERGYKRYIEIAHRHGMKIYIATILPCPRCLNDGGVRETIRCAVNDWIRSNSLADGFIDFEAAVWDEDNHKRIKSEYDSGDQLHPSLKGSEIMAAAIPVELFRD